MQPHNLNVDLVDRILCCLTIPTLMPWRAMVIYKLEIDKRLDNNIVFNISFILK